MKSQITASNADILRALIKKSLMAWTLATMPRYRPSWHHHILVEKLEAVERGEIKRLLIMMPPRHGKSEIASVRFPPWYLGRHPEEQIISASYGGTLAQEFGRKVLHLCEGDIFSTVFGHDVSADSRATNRWNLVNGGGYRAAGIGAGITGKGANGLIVDDPIKSRKEANSLTFRNSIWNWYTNDAYTRLEDDAWVILILTHWHEDDLAGRILEQAKTTGEKWDVLSLPAEAEEGDEYRLPGEPLWPEKYGVEALKRIRGVLDDTFFNALYQQRPSVQGGNIIKKSFFDKKFYLTTPASFDRMLQSWDFTFKGNDDSDYVVGQVWGKVGKENYLLDQVRARLSFSDSIKAFLRLSEKWPGATVRLVEDKANGTAIMDALSRKGVKFKPVEPLGSKEERAEVAAEVMEAGHVWLPDPSIAPWVSGLLEEWYNFPNAANDDQVDSGTQAINYLNKSRTYEIIDLGNI